MLIFTLPSWYKTEKRPEDCIFIYEQMQALKKLGHTVVVLSVIARRPLKSIPDKITDDNGIPTYYTYVPALKPSKFRAPFEAEFEKGLKRLYDKASKDYGKPDVLYAHFTFAAGYGALKLSKQTGVPLVIQEHYSGLMNDKIDKALEKYLSESVQKADGFICVSEGLKQSIINKTGVGNDIKVISNMINPCFTYSEPQKKDDFVFFSCGALIPRKRFNLLIKAFSEAFKDNSEVKLRIGGSGAMREELTELINSLGMSGRISLLGQLSREATLSEYQNCDAFALPSAAETYGLVYREAMAVGRPVISTRHGGFGSDWSDSFGKLIDIDDKSQLIKALKHIYENYSDYDLKRISEECLKGCSETGVAEQISGYLAQKIKD